MKLIRSRRQTIALMIDDDGTLVVRAPHSAKEQLILKFVQEKKDWIDRASAKVLAARQAASQISLTREQIKEHREQAFMLLTQRCRYYAEQMGLKYKGIRLSNARRRWGSCSARGTLCFNWRLVLAPLEVLDYVVVHELAHLRHLNHSPDFWATVQRFYPDVVSAKRWLKEQSSFLMFSSSSF